MNYDWSSSNTKGFFTTKLMYKDQQESFSKLKYVAISLYDSRNWSTSTSDQLFYVLLYHHNILRENIGHPTVQLDYSTVDRLTLSCLAWRLEILLLSSSKILALRCSSFCRSTDSARFETATLLFSSE